MSDLMNLEQASTYLNMTPKQLRWQRYVGKAPRAALIGGRVTFRRSDLDAWISEQFEAAS